MSVCVNRQPPYYETRGLRTQVDSKDAASIDAKIMESLGLTEEQRNEILERV